MAARGKRKIPLLKTILICVTLAGVFIRLPLLLLTAVLILSGCAATNRGHEATVVTTVYPLEFIATQVAGKNIKVTNLAVPGAEPHDLALQPSQVAELGKATAVLYSSGFQPEVDKAIAVGRPAHVVDAMKLIPKSDGSIEDSTRDPHFWLDPSLMTKVVTGFATELAEADPAHSASYRANAQALNQRLEELDATYQAGLAQCRIRSIVVSHNAFSYLASRYDLTVHSIAGLSPDAEPSPKYLHQLTELIRSEGITTVFYEPIASRSSAQTVATETGTSLAVLDPIEGVPANSTADYFSLMQANLLALQKANQCQ